MAAISISKIERREASATVKNISLSPHHYIMTKTNLRRERGRERETKVFNHIRKGRLRPTRVPPKQYENKVPTTVDDISI